MSIFDRNTKYGTEEKLKVMKARTNLVMHEPFFGNLALQMQLIEDPRVPTMAVNGEWIRYNPAFVNSMDSDELKGVVAHEVMHVAMMHHLRRGERKNKFWQIATDNAINHLLKQSGFSLPDGGCWDARFIGMNAEKIYEILESEAIEEELKNKQDENGEKSDSGGMAKGADPNAGNQKSPTLSKQQGQGNVQPKDNNQKEQPDDYKPSEDPGGYGAVEDADNLKNMNQGEKDTLEKEWKDNIMSAATAQKMHGNVPEWFEDFIETTKEPKIHYTELLRDFLEEKTKDDYSMMHPNTRYAEVTRQSGMALPGLMSDAVGNIGFIVDSSGSISPAEKERYASEISQVLEDFPSMEIDVIYVDTRVANVQHLTTDDLPLKLKFRGGGGTSFVPGFDWIKENETDPKCVIYFTDGYSSRFPEEPPYPVIWLCTSGAETMQGGYREAPFGEVLGLEIE